MPECGTVSKKKKMLSLNTHLIWALLTAPLGKPNHEADPSPQSLPCAWGLPRAETHWNSTLIPSNQSRHRNSVYVCQIIITRKSLHSETPLLQKFCDFLIDVGKVIYFPFFLVS